MGAMKPRRSRIGGTTLFLFHMFITWPAFPHPAPPDEFTLPRVGVEVWQFVHVTYIRPVGRVSCMERYGKMGSGNCFWKWSCLEHGRGYHRPLVILWYTEILTISKLITFNRLCLQKVKHRSKTKPRRVGQLCLFQDASHLPQSSSLWSNIPCVEHENVFGTETSHQYPPIISRWVLGSTKNSCAPADRWSMVGAGLAKGMSWPNTTLFESVISSFERRYGSIISKLSSEKFDFW